MQRRRGHNTAQRDLEPERLAGEEAVALLTVRGHEPGALQPRLARAGTRSAVLERRRTIVGKRPAVARDRLVHRAVERERPVAQERRAVAQPLDRGRVVRDEEDRAAPLLEGGDHAEALPLEALVADREDLVEEQHVRLEERGDREPEPHRHAGRVRADGAVDRVLELGEGDDLVEALADPRAGEPLEHPVQLDVLPAREVGMEAGAELEERPDATSGWRHGPRWA